MTTQNFITILMTTVTSAFGSLSPSLFIIKHSVLPPFADHVIIYIDPKLDDQRAWNHSDALRHCRDQGYDLASIHNGDQMDIANNLCGSSWCWIGLRYDEDNDEWSWTDGSKLDYGFNADGSPTNGVWPWQVNEPNFAYSVQFHVCLVANAQGWNDYYDNVATQRILCNNVTLEPTFDPTIGMYIIHVFKNVLLTMNIFRNIEIVDPTTDPTDDPTSDPTTDPTIEPTTMCDPYQNCADCLNMNPDEFTQCLWHSDHQECILTNQIDDSDFIIYDEASCPMVNELCDDASWSEVSGNWTFNAMECSLHSTGGSSADNNEGMVWFGSFDGKTPDTNYCHSYFVLVASVLIHSGKRLGISFRSETSSDTYYLRLNSKTGFIGIYQLSDGVTIDDTDPLYFMNVGITIGTIYNVTIMAEASVYDIYLNGENVLDDILLTNLTNYNNCSIGINAWNSEVTFISLTYNGADTAFPTNAPNTSPTSMPTYIPTRVPTDPTSQPSDEPTSSPSNAPSNAPSVAPSDTPSDAPSNAPSNAPSQSPTRYPFAYSEFDSAVTAIFNITGWTTSEVTTVNNDWELFTSSLTEYIHQGFDEDPVLEFRYIVTNVTYINDITVDELINMDSNEIGSILWGIVANGMKLQYLIECSTYFQCVYVAESDPSYGMDRIPFEESVSANVNMYFMPVSANADSSLSFTVESMTLMTIEYDSEKTQFEIRFDSTILLVSILSFVLLASATCSLIALIAVHSHRPGSDRPNYLSAFKFGFNIADFYTDVIWTLTLVFEQSEYALYALLFTFGSYAISIIVGISYVIRWKSSRRSKLYLSEYGEQYGKVVLICSALAGFYATSELVTSHLCHLSVLSLHMTAAQQQQIQILRILNIVLLENLPLLILQILYLSSANHHATQSVDLTMITVMFSSLSIISVISNIITILFSRCISNHHRNDSNSKSILFEFTLKEQFAGNIKSYHVHSHNRLQQAIAESLQLTKNQVVLYKIQKISGGLMVMGKLKFLSEEQREHLKEQLENQQSEMRINLKRECVDNLKIKVARYIELNDIKLQLIDQSRGGNALAHKLSGGSVDAEIAMSDIVRIAEGIKMPKVIENPNVADITPFESRVSVDGGEVHSEDGVEGAETQ